MLPTEGIACGSLLATPNTMDAMAPKTTKAVEREATVTRKGRTKFANLRDQLYHGIKMLPTPRASDADKGVRSPEGHAKERERRKNGVDLPTAVDGASHGLRLQPGFALWMMGYPTDWCDLEAGEMPPSKRQVTPSSRKLPKKSLMQSENTN